MTVGILTEKGIQMIKAPILISEGNEGYNLLSWFKIKDNSKHAKMSEIQAALKKLKDLDELKGLKAVRAN
jgi:hypothetical protein